MALEQFTEKAFGGPAITPALEQDIDDIAVLVNGTPQILSLPLYGHEHFVQQPMVARCRLMTPQTAGVVGPESLTPTPDGFVALNDPALCKQVFGRRPRGNR